MMAALDYCTLADVEAYCGVDFADGIGPSTAEINTILIPNASRLLDDYAGRQLAGTTSVTEYYDVHQRQRHLITNFRPISTLTSISEVESDGTETALTSGMIRNTDDFYLADSEAGLIRFYNGYSIDIPAFLKVTYDYGSATVPIYAKMACIALVVSQCARAALNDENCMERVKEMWATLLDSSLADYRDLLKDFKSHAQVGVGVYGGFSMNRAWGR